MKRKFITVGILAGAVAALLFLLLPSNSIEESESSTGIYKIPAQVVPPSKSKESLIVVEKAELSSEELRELEAMFEPVAETRKVTEVIILGQSILCDVFPSENGNLAFTFLTPKPVHLDSGETALSFESETSILHQDGSMVCVSAPTVITREGQPAQISMGTEGRTPYSMQISGFFIDEATVTISAEFSGDLTAARTPRQQEDAPIP